MPFCSETREYFSSAKGHRNRYFASLGLAKLPFSPRKSGVAISAPDLHRQGGGRHMALQDDSIFMHEPVVAFLLDDESARG